MRDEISPILRALHLATLTAFAVAQPLFDLLQQFPTFLVAHGADRGDVAGLAISLGVLIPVAVGVLLTTLSQLAGRTGRLVHLGCVALLLILIALPLAKRAASGLAPVLGGAVLAGCVVALAYARFPVLRTLTSVLSLVLVVFPASFAMDSRLREALDPFVDVASAQLRALRPAPVVVVVFDALALHALVDAGGNVDARRYPGFAALARDSTWFRNASTVAEKTRSAIPAIVTGRYPRADVPPVASRYPDNLFTMLSASHSMHVLEPVTRLCPVSLCGERATRRERLAAIARDLRPVILRALLPAALLRDVPEVSRTWRSFGDRDSYDADAPDAPGGRGAADAEWLLEQFLAALQPDAGPALHFAHFQVPHWPYRYLPSGARYDGFGRHTTPQYDDASRWRQPLYAEANSLAPYLLQVAYVDGVLSRIVSRLRETGLYDDALVVVLSDHGIGFRPGVHPRVIEPGSVADIVPVPLFVKLPHQSSGRVSERNVETIDVLPTLLDVLGASPLRPLDGTSLLDESLPERDAKHVFVHRRGESRRFDYPSSIEGRMETAKRAAAFFDLSRGTDGLFAVASARNVLGRTVDSLTALPTPELRFELDHAFAYEAVDPASGFVPAFVSGRIQLPEAHDRFPLYEVLVAVNGVVRGATRPFDREGRWARFETLVPASSFQPGRNRIDLLLEIDAGPGPRHLRAAATQSASWRLVEPVGGDAAHVLTPDGVRLPLRANAIYASVRRVRIDYRGEAAAEAVLLFANGEFLAERRAGEESPMTFEFPVPFISNGESDGASLRFIAVDAGIASEIIPD